ncbi:phosphatidylinositol 4,5-bisphosphate 5-phosphatase A isoform X2 [Cervus canadensis]|uniref:phosphatidylinositol 4,5-bisphosphate 5-phosphatase A isoform X2 n=1 Tax=Cervus canadensis TaxID=1574408 RepID=UPI001C9E24E9|nr:phosphatidylinositol 4,5-bisphosphate 5-phosphatase A isoform X2 [Cervus canadensis]
MEGRGVGGSGRPGTPAGLGPLPMPHGISQTGAPSKVPAKKSAPVPLEPRLALTPVGPRAAIPPSSEGPRLALASPQPILAPASTPGGQKTAPAHRRSGLAPTCVGQLVMSASAGPKPLPATSGSVLAPSSLGQLLMSASAGPRPPSATPRPRLAPLSRDQEQVPPASMGPEPALAASGLNRAMTSEKQPPQPPHSSSPGPSPVLSPSQEQVLAPASVTPALAPTGWTPAKQRDTPAPRPPPHSDGHLPAPAQASAQPTCKSDPGFWITVVTWNVGTAMPPDDVTSLLHLGSTSDDSDRADMIAIGLQEVNSMINKRLKDALFTDQWSELFMDALGPFNFVLVSTVRMQGVILLLFAKYYHLPFLRDVQTDRTRTGLGGYWGNKGGVSVRLAAFGHMLCFLNCHLPAHMDKAEQRKDNFQTILSLQQFQGPGAQGILDHDLVFWFGDLNFRIESYDLHFVKLAIDSEQLHQLWEKDQLNMAKNTWPILKGFQEGPLNFAPTFKFDVGTNKYDTSAKKRKPAWTDRILWKVKAPGGGPSPSGRESHRLQVTQYSYRSHMEYTVSDHKPVAAQFVLHFAFRDDVPLVRLEVADEWVRPEQAVVRYRIETVFARSSWDWIGLYRVGFRHCKDYVAYVWAKHEDVDGSTYQVTFSEESLPKGHGDFILGYYSHTHSILIGVTEPFQISLPTSEPTSSSTDSSDSSSEDEDDSTVELLAPKSRSPSPGKSKRHRSRSPGLARFPNLALRPSSRERRGTSRSPSPQSRHLPQAAPDRGSNGGSRGSSEEGPPGLPGAWAFPPSVPRSLGLLPALRLETVDPGGGSSWGPDREALASSSSLSPSPQGRQGLEEGGLGP